MVDQAQSASPGVVAAYDTTVVGWVRVLALRESHFASHTRRVVNWTLFLAKTLGIAGEELEYIRHGAMLHHISILGIPDQILFKPSPLTEDNLQILQHHPVLAYAVLSPIDFLRPALDIPYRHHEHWDGSGYPRSLKGEQIPFAARLFAMANTWDDLSSDNAHRLAFRQDAVIGQIKLQARKQLDPKMVDAFLTMLSKDQ